MHLLAVPSRGGEGPHLAPLLHPIPPLHLHPRHLHPALQLVGLVARALWATAAAEEAVGQVPLPAGAAVALAVALQLVGGAAHPAMAAVQEAVDLVPLPVGVAMALSMAPQLVGVVDRPASSAAVMVLGPVLPPAGAAVALTMALQLVRGDRARVSEEVRDSAGLPTGPPQRGLICVCWCLIVMV